MSRVISLAEFRTQREGLALIRAWRDALARREPKPAPPARRERAA